MFPDTLFVLLKQLYPKVFDFQGLKIELVVFYRTSVFQKKSPVDLLQFLKREGLDSSFKEVFRLANLTCTIPATTASVERSFSALKRIHTYKRSSQTEERLSNLALMSIEKGLLESLREKNDFYNVVIQKFAAKTRRPSSCINKILE
ncbi:uncharacterized protein LOC120354552 [Nilaparvata lugens]|uniref:uncharacterized protein LOC120354552 n=1 Tax=Nilaparvata lugens TaxID=108931 RepID=UPI00193E593D|nr:uncharacterized protein LOC120354552 [Nilaparvata lugens]